MKEMKTITEVREHFWSTHPEFKDEYRKTYRQNDYRADIRMAFVDMVDNLKRENLISEKLAFRVTL